MALGSDVVAPACPAVQCTALQPTGKERVICLTAQRRSKQRGFKGTLHICKLSAPQGSYQVWWAWACAVCLFGDAVLQP